MDSNVLVSAALFKGSVGRKAVDKALNGGYIVLSMPVTAELRDVFSRSRFDKYLSAELRAEFLADLQSIAEIVDIAETVRVCCDLKDDKFLDLALNSCADYIISSDKDLLVLHPFREIEIISPAAFLKLGLTP